MIRKVLFTLLILLFFVPSSWALDQSTALDQVARKLFEGGRVPKDKSMSLELVNETNQKQDRTANKLKSALSLALQRQGFKILRADESLTGVGSSVISLKASYEARGGELVLTIRAQHMTSGEVFDQTRIAFARSGASRGDLFAVLDLEAKALNPAQRKFFSDSFRTALRQTGQFDIASSAEVDKMDPDSVQKQLGCTRDECATVIGEQLGVDQVVSTAYTQIQGDLYGLTATVIDIHGGRISGSATVKHQGDLTTLDKSLAALAKELAKEFEAPVPKVAVPAPAVIPPPMMAQRRPEPVSAPSSGGEFRVFYIDEATDFTFDWSQGNQQIISYMGPAYGIRGMGDAWGTTIGVSSGEFDQFSDDGVAQEGWIGSMSGIFMSIDHYWYSSGVGQGSQLVLALGLGFAARDATLTFGSNDPYEFSSFSTNLTASLDYTTSFGFFFGAHMSTALSDSTEFTTYTDLNSNLIASDTSSAGMMLGITF
ncbi:MAG: hypothetical protein RRB13_08505 [bacterium]|nr:hypothetical protein [bacterium]